MYLNALAVFLLLYVYLGLDFRVSAVFLSLVF